MIAPASATTRGGEGPGDLAARVGARFRELPVPIDDPRARIAELVAEEAPLFDPVAVQDAAARIHAELSGLGPLEALCADPTVSDVLVNGPGGRLS